MTAAFLLSERPITPAFLISESFKENDSPQFAKQTVWSKFVVRGKGISANLKANVFVECIPENRWVVLCGGLLLNVHNCQDILDIISILEK